MTNGIIFDIKKYAIHDGPGIRTTVFFKGCPLNCLWCHNPEGLKPEPETIVVDQRRYDAKSGTIEKDKVFGWTVSVSEIMTEIKKDRIFYEESGGGVTFSGGEPMMQIDFLLELMELCKKEKINIALDSCGCAPWDDFEKTVELVDYFLYDIKFLDDELHEKYVGISNKLLLENLERLSKTGAKIIIRLPMIPYITDSEQNLRAIAAKIKLLKNIQYVSLLPYNQLREDKLSKFKMTSDLQNLKTQTTEQMESFCNIFRQNGFAVKVGG